MSALFDFRSFLTVMLLSICSCTYVKMRAPQVRAVPASGPHTFFILSPGRCLP